MIIIVIIIICLILRDVNMMLLLNINLILYNNKFHLKIFIIYLWHYYNNNKIIYIIYKIFLLFISLYVKQIITFIIIILVV